MIFCGKRSGKTVWLVMEAAKRQGTIIVGSRERAEFLQGLAKDLGLRIPEPMVLEPKTDHYVGITFAGVIVDEPDFRRNNA